MKTFYLSGLFLLADLLPLAAQANTSHITLNECTQAAFKYSPLVKKANNELNIAGLNVKVASSGYYPTVSSELSSGFSNQSDVDDDYRTENFNIGASQTLWQKGKTRATVDQANYAVSTANYSLEAARQDLLLEVKTSFYSYYLRNQLYKIAADNVSKAQLFLDYANERYKVGIGRKTDVLKAESDLTEAEFERDSYLTSLHQNKNRLVMLTGLPSSTINNPTNPWDSTFLLNINYYSDSIYAIALSKYPELHIANNLTLSQQSRIKETESALYPILSVNGGYNWNYTALTKQQKGWYSALTLQWTIFNGYERRYRLQSEKIRSDVFQNQKADTEDFLLKEIRNGILSIQNAENQIKTSSSLMITTSANLEIAQAEYKAGTGSMLELTDARFTDLNARKKYEEGITSFLIAVANLERLTGDLNNK